MQSTNQPLPSAYYYFRGIFKYLKRFPLLLFVILLCIVISAAFQLFSTYATKLLIDDALPRKDLALTITIIAAFGSLLILTILATIVQTKLTSRLSFHIASMFKLKLFDAALHGAGIGNQIEKESTFTTRFVKDVTQLEALVHQTQWNFFSDCIMLVSGTVLLFLFDWKMAIVGIALFLATIPLPHFYLRRGLRLQIERKQTETNAIGKLKESIGVNEIIRLFRLQASRRRAFMASVKKTKHIAIGASEEIALGNRLSASNLDLTSFLLMSVGIYLIFTSDLTIGRLFGFLGLFRIVGVRINSLLTSTIDIKHGAYSMLTLEKVLASQPKRHHRSIQDLAPLHDAIVFKDVALQIGDKTIVHDVNFRIPAGTSAAFVGTSGAGKSTLLRLLLRENEVSRGEIYLDNQPLSEISTKALLSQFGVVAQEPKLLQGTIRENIVAGKLDATEEQIILASKKAELYNEIINFPKGFDTVINKEGFQPSGGQRQRLTIARALIGEPPIFCFDEAASALDPFADKAIEDTLKSLAGDHTLISITHRLASAVFADQIIVLDKGAIVETGSHNALLDANGLYSQLWEKQNGFILNKKDRTVEVKPSWLKRIPLFSNLDENTLIALADNFLLQREDPDTIVVKQGGPGDSIYIIASGIVEVSTTDPNTNETIVYAKLTDGDFFGEIALLYDMPRTANVETKSICLFLCLHRHQFDRFLEDAPESVRADIRQKAQQRLKELGIHTTT